MGIRGKVARAAVAAGLGLVLGCGSAAPALAAGASDTPVVGESANPEYTAQVGASSTGDTKLYIISEQDDITRPEGAVDENIKVSIPVAIHYVADAQGNLVGPSDDTVKFVNHTKLGAVHVSKIAVQDAGDAKIVMDGDDLANDQMSFFVRPTQGQSDAEGSAFVRGTATEGNDADYVKVGSVDQLGSYASKTSSEAVNPTNRNDWNIAQKHGALALNGLTGRIGGFGSIDPATDYQAGTIHWTVRAGTRAQADKRDASVTIHYNSNNGSNKNCVPVGDQIVQVLDSTKLPNRVADQGGMTTALDAGASDVTAPKTRTNADGTQTTWRFKGWYKNADGSGSAVTTIGDLGEASAIAGTVQELYAVYEVVQ